MPHHGLAPNYGSRVPVDTAPGPAPVCRALKKQTPFQLIILTMSCPQRVFQQVKPWGARLFPPRRHLWNSHHQHNRDVDHLVEVKLGSLYDLLNSLIMGIASAPRQGCDDLRNRDIDQSVEERWGNSVVRQTVWTMGIGLCTTTATTTNCITGALTTLSKRDWGPLDRGKCLCATTGKLKSITGTSITKCTATGESRPWGKPLRHDRDVNLHDMHNRGIDHRIQQQQGNLYGHKDHGDEPQCHDRKDNDLDELQLRENPQFSAV